MRLCALASRLMYRLGMVGKLTLRWMARWMRVMLETWKAGSYQHIRILPAPRTSSWRVNLTIDLGQVVLHEPATPKVELAHAVKQSTSNNFNIDLTADKRHTQVYLCRVFRIREGEIEPGSELLQSISAVVETLAALHGRKYAVVGVEENLENSGPDLEGPGCFRPGGHPVRV